MGSGNSVFRPLFMVLLLVVISTFLMMGFYYQNYGSITSPMPSDSPEKESLAARSLLGAVEVFKPYTGDQPILTMFTTFKNAKDRFQIHSNVLHNWAQYIPVIRPILFTYDTDAKLISIAKNLGWLVLPCPRVSGSKVPYFKDMYFEAQKQVESVFYGYFNGDLLFDDGLINTLTVVERYLDQLHKTMIVGQRTNFAVKNARIFKKSDVSTMAKHRGKLFRTDAEDFFIIAHNSFMWEKIAEIVIGRPAYDNYIVGMAIKNHISVVDATKTLLALHQSGSDGDFAGHKNKDRNFNFKAIGPFNWASGVTSASQYFTKYKDNNIELWQRSPAKKLIAKVRTTLAPPTQSTPAVTTILQNETEKTQFTSPDSTHFVSAISNSSAFPAQVTNHAKKFSTPNSSNSSYSSNVSPSQSLHSNKTASQHPKSANSTLEKNNFTKTNINDDSIISNRTYSTGQQDSALQSNVPNYRIAPRDNFSQKDSTPLVSNRTILFTQSNQNYGLRSQNASYSGTVS